MLYRLEELHGYNLAVSLNSAVFPSYVTQHNVGILLKLYILFVTYFENYLFPILFCSFLCFNFLINN
jgi:hypothetical protein